MQASITTKFCPTFTLNFNHLYMLAYLIYIYFYIGIYVMFLNMKKVLQYGD